jgi:hypothetical protein
MQRATSLALLLTLTGAGVMAQEAPATGNVATSGAEGAPLASAELGRTPMSEAFSVWHPPVANRRGAARRPECPLHGGDLR